MLDEAKSTLEQVLELDNSAFGRSLLNHYILPAANYEMAILTWVEKRTGTLAKTKKISGRQS
ncbi:hypothetical protein F4861DRAFT_127101 [Xylaria intraflava]|nr:hypothetical protein F4861DRAFT_127101 [Xylaria intraflava]